MLTAIPSTILNQIETIFLNRFGQKLVYHDFNYASGGCINNTGILSTNEGKYFLKWNSKSRFPDLFEKEAQGLILLKEAKHSIKIPEVVFHSSDDSHVFILMEYLERSSPGQTYWEDFGNGLAELHLNQGESHGLEYDNYIGSLEQSNNQQTDWEKFFIQNRLLPMFKMAYNRGLFDKSYQKEFDSFISKLPALMPNECLPSLMHGDLWSGNVMIDEIGKPAIIDPAVYYGFREMEIAFTELFGRFGEGFYQAYNDAWPLESGYSERKDIWNLYPLLVHVNLFGGSYVRSVKEIIRIFI